MNKENQTNTDLIKTDENTPGITVKIVSVEVKEDPPKAEYTNEWSILACWSLFAAFLTYSAHWLIFTICVIVFMISAAFAITKMIDRIENPQKYKD